MNSRLNNIGISTGSIIINAALNLEGQDAGMYGQHLVTFTLTAPHVEAIGSRASKSRKR